MAGRVHREAVISDDGRYRYSLTCSWGMAGPSVLFVMHNPSTADANQDDPTIRRCVGFAESWGARRLMVGNVYASRATDRRQMDPDDPVGPENDRWLSLMATGATIVVAAWGASVAPERAKAVKAILRAHAWDGTVRVLRLTKRGHPWHPLYVPKDAQPVPWLTPSPPTR